MVLCLFLDVLFIHLTQLHYKLNSEKKCMHKFNTHYCKRNGWDCIVKISIGITCDFNHFTFMYYSLYV